MDLQWPNEVLHHIFSRLAVFEIDKCPDLVDIRSRISLLARLCQVSRQFRIIAEPLLYRHIVIASVELLETLGRRPDLANHIYRLDLGCVKRECPNLYERYRDNGVREYIQSIYHNEGLLDLLDQAVCEAGDEPSRDFLIVCCLLLVVARNVEIVDFGASGAVHPAISDLFQFGTDELRRASERPEFDHMGNIMTPVLPLSKLRILEAGVYTSVGERHDLEGLRLMPLMYHHSLEEFSSHSVFLERDQHGGQLDAYETPFLSYHLPWRRPMLRSFVLHHSELGDGMGLRNVLIMFPNLEKLVLRLSCKEYRKSMDFQHWGDDLRCHGTKLKVFELELAYDDLYHLEENNMGIVGQLRDHLLDLRQLKMPLIRLIGDGGGYQLCNVLPQGLKYLWVEKTRRGNLEVHDAAIQRLLEDAPKGGLPELEWVVTTGQPKGDQVAELAKNWDIQMLGRNHVLYRRRGMDSLISRVIMKAGRRVKVTAPIGWDGLLEI